MRGERDEMRVESTRIESRSRGQTTARWCADVLVTTDEMRSGLGGGTCARMVALAAALQQRAGLAVALVEVVEQVAEVAEMTDGARQASVNLWQPLGRSRSRMCRKRGDELRPDATGGDEVGTFCVLGCSDAT